MNLEDEVRYLILGLQREGNRQIAQVLAPAAVTPSQAEAISLLAEHEVLSLRDLGALLVCESGDSPSRLIDRLVDRGLVQKEISTLDRRSLSLTLTSKGVDIYRNVIEPAEVGIRKAIREALSQEEINQLHELLMRFAGVTNSSGALNARRERQST